MGLPLRKSLTTLLVLYPLSCVFALLASIPMVLHVYPQSECILFSSSGGGKLFYGHYASEF